MTSKVRFDTMQWEGRKSKEHHDVLAPFVFVLPAKNVHVRAAFVRRQIPPILVFLDGKNISSCCMLLPHFCVFHQTLPRKAFPRYPSVKKLGGLVCQLVPLFVFYLVVAFANIVAWPILFGAFSPEHRRSHKTYGRACKTRCHIGVNRIVWGFDKAHWTRSPRSK